MHCFAMLLLLGTRLQSRLVGLKSQFLVFYGARSIGGTWSSFCFVVLLYDMVALW